MDFVSEAETDCTQASDTVTCISAGLASGASDTYVIRVKAVLMPGANNIAQITAWSTPDPNTGNNSDGENTSFATGTSALRCRHRRSGLDEQYRRRRRALPEVGQWLSTNYKLKATNPGTFKYRLSLENETGIDIHVKGKQLPNIIRRGVSIKDRNGARRRSS